MIAPCPSNTQNNRLHVLKDGGGDGHEREVLNLTHFEKFQKMGQNLKISRSPSRSSSFDFVFLDIYIFFFKNKRNPNTQFTETPSM